MAGTIRDLGPRVVWKNKNLVFEGSGRIRQDAIVVHDDFTGDTLDTFWSSVNKDAGATNFAITVGAGGTITAACGATNNDKAEIAGEIVWLPSKGLSFETRVHLSAATTVAAVFGFTDAKTEAAQTLPASLSGTTFTTTASDACLWLYDTGATTKTWRGVGVKADTDGTHVDSSIAPVASTYQRFRIDVDTDGTAIFSILDDANPYSAAPLYQGVVANACTASTLLVPYFGIQARTTSSRTITVDYLDVAQNAR